MKVLMQKRRARLAVKAETTLRRELHRVQRLLKMKGSGLDLTERAWMYGAQQALSWALNQDAAAPVQLVNKPKREAAHA